jgi:predicted permease
MLPAFIVTRERHSLSLGALSAAATELPKMRRARQIAVCVQLAMTLILMTGAGLVLKVFFDSAHRDTGLAQTSAVQGALIGDASRITSTPDRLAFAQGLEERLRQIPSAEAVGVRGSPNVPPFDGMTREGDDQMVAAGIAPSDAESVTPDLFRAMGIKVVAGRVFNLSDDAAEHPVAILDEPTARRLFPNGHAVGRRIKFGAAASPEPWMTIVGIVGGVRSLLPGTQRYRPVMFRPLAQAPPTPFLSFAVRSRGPSTELLPLVAAAIHAFAPHDPLAGLTTVEARTNQRLAPLRLNAILMGGLAIICIVMAMIGTYSLIAFSIERRRREIAIRAALGASRATLVWFVLSGTLLIAGVATLSGVAGSFAGTRVLRAMLYGTSTTDWRVFSCAAAGIIVMSVAASIAPAWRAAATDPCMAMRAE